MISSFHSLCQKKNENLLREAKFISKKKKDAGAYSQCLNYILIQAASLDTVWKRPQLD